MPKLIGITKKRKRIPLVQAGRVQSGARLPMTLKRKMAFKRNATRVSGGPSKTQRPYGPKPKTRHPGRAYPKPRGRLVPQRRGKRVPKSAGINP